MDQGLVEDSCTTFPILSNPKGYTLVLKLLSSFNKCLLTTYSIASEMCVLSFSLSFPVYRSMDSKYLQLQHSVCACESISHQKTPIRFSSDFCRRAEVLCLDCSAFSQLSWNELVYKEFKSSLGRTRSLGGSLFGPTSRPALAHSPRAQHYWSPGLGLNLALPLSSETLLCLIYHLNHLKDFIS